MKVLNIFLLFFLLFLNIKSNNRPKFDFNLDCQHKKKDSISNIPSSFLDFKKNSKGFCLVHGNSEIKQMVLTFDDGPTEVSLKIIEILNKYDAKGSFFWVGERMKNNTKIIQAALKNGHLIANHSWNHENAYLFSNQLLWDSQVEKTLNEFTKYGIDEVVYYRPPFGGITQNQIDYLATKNIKTVLWSITTMDWDPNENRENLMLQKVKTHIHPGAIVLMHDYDYGHLDSKLKDLEEILKFGISNGYKFVTVSELEQ